MKLSVALLFFISTAHAAPLPSNGVQIQRSLRLPTEMRMQSIQSMGQQGFDGLTRIAFNNHEKLENRWRAITTLGRAYPRLARLSLEKAMRSPEWFMRNAAAIVLKYGSRDWAVNWARMLMHDPALVVRSAAVEVLKELHATEAEPLLWEKLYSSENFKGGQSLWVRHQIAEALVQLSKKNKAENFYKMLSDGDARLRGFAIAGLKKSTSQNFETSQEWVAWMEKKNDTAKIIR